MTTSGNMDELSKIYSLLDSNNYNGLIEKINDYIKKYPEDTLGHVVKAEYYYYNGCPNDALEEVIKYKHEKEHGFDKLERVGSLYGNILIALGREDEGLKQLNRAMEEHKNKGINTPSFAQREIIQYYMDRNEYDMALDICDYLPKNDEIYYRQGKIFMYKGDFKRAVESFSKVRNASTGSDTYKSHYYFYYAKSCLYTGDSKEAMKYFQLCLKYKNDLYDRVCYYIGCLYFRDKKYSTAINFAKRIIKSDEYKNYSYSLLTEIMMKIYRYDKAEEYANLIDDSFWKDHYLSQIHFAKKDYEKAEEKICNLLSNSSKEFNDHINYYIKCKFRLKKYDEVLYIIDCLRGQGYIPSQEIRKIELYLKSDKYDVYDLPYKVKQVLNYDKDSAIKFHEAIYNDKEALTHLNDHDIEKVMDKVKSGIEEVDGIADGLYDKYLCYYKRVGKTKEQMGTRDNTNYVEVITSPDTKDIIHMYPIDGVEGPLKTDNFQRNKVLLKKDKYIGKC